MQACVTVKYFQVSAWAFDVSGVTAESVEKHSERFFLLAVKRASALNYILNFDFPTSIFNQ
jgi:hypothetical protein